MRSSAPASIFTPDRLRWSKMRMDMAPLVSVLIPSFNHCRYVARSIESVLNQTYQNIELIVIDDGSSDGSVQVIRNLAARHGFRFEAQENQGVVATLNRAKQMVSGKYVALSASDDYFHPAKIETLVDFMERHPDYALVHSNLIQIDAESREVGRIRERCPSGRVFHELLCGKFHVNGLSALVRADIYARFRYGAYYIDDLYMWLSIAEHHPIGFVDEFLAYYRRHDNHLTGNSEKMEMAERQILECFAHSEHFEEAVLRWREKWFNHYASSRRLDDRRRALERGRSLLRDRCFSPRCLKGWARMVINRV